MFERDITVRLRRVLPLCGRRELDISCLICGGEAAPAANSGWLELCPADDSPQRAEDGRHRPGEYTGFAFGLSLTRLAMMKYGIKDIRDLNSGNEGPEPV
ncbi:MAG: hypothetical protein ACLRSY_00955 [Acutalibacter sp.]